MNGYCEYHTFDRAVDVCNVCYGDLCRSCAVMLAGRRHATCKECVIDLSGVRTLARPVERGDKATVKARREQYASVDDDEYFQFFTSGAETERSTEADSAPERRRGRFRLGRSRSSTRDEDLEMTGRVSNDGSIRNPDPAGHGEFHQESRPAKAVTRLDRLRRSLHHGGTHPGEGTPAQATTTSADEEAADRPEVDEELSDPALVMLSTAEPLTEPEDEPAEVQTQPQAVPFQPATTGSSSADQTLERAMFHPTARLDAEDEPEQFEPADLSVDPFELAESRPFAAPVRREPPTPPPSLNPQTQTPAPQPPTPPPSLNPQTQTPAPQPPTPPPSDDTDEEGRWIPPALRGVVGDTARADVETTRRL